MNTKISLTRRARWIIIGVAIAALLVAAAVVTPALLHDARAHAYVTTLRSDPRASVDGLPDEQLIASFEGYCERITKGLTIDGLMAGSQRNWEATKHVANVTEAEYYDNLRAFFDAAKAHC